MGGILAAAIESGVFAAAYLAMPACYDGHCYELFCGFKWPPLNSLSTLSFSLRYEVQLVRSYAGRTGHSKDGLRWHCLT
eukprot:3619216-Amphidinium_carterae.2